MNALEITNIKTDEDFSLFWTINSLYVPYGMQENFIVMEKTPDYLFHYISLSFREKNLHKNYSLDMSKKSITNDIDEITFSTNHPEFFNQMKNTMSILEKYFHIFVSVINNYNSSEEFVHQINKLQLFENLQNNLQLKEFTSSKNKI